MLIVGCQSCGETKILAGTPDVDGVARMNWCCPHCGAGQVLQLEVNNAVRMSNLYNALGGMALAKNALSDIGDELRSSPYPDAN
jgi:ribosomal protein S27AE